MRVSRASDPPFVDHSTIPRVDITQMNTRARISKSICAKHSPQQHFPKRHLRCSSSFLWQSNHEAVSKLHCLPSAVSTIFHYQTKQFQIYTFTHTHTHTHTHTIGLGSVRASILNLRDIVLWNVRASILSQEFCIQFVSKLIIFLPDLDQPIFTCPRA